MKFDALTNPTKTSERHSTMLSTKPYSTKYDAGFAKRYCAKVVPGPIRPPMTTRCQDWIGSRTHDGYGQIGFKREDGTRTLLYVHRVSLELKLGRDLKPGMKALHHCDVPWCVNPKHLYEGTAADNHRDHRERGDSPYVSQVYTNRPDYRTLPANVTPITTGRRRRKPTASQRDREASMKRHPSMAGRSGS